MALGIWKRLPVGRRAELLKKMSAQANRVSSVTGVESTALQQLNRRMQIVLPITKFASSVQSPKAGEAGTIRVTPNGAGSGTAAQTLNVDPGEGAVKNFVGRSAPAQAQTYASAGVKSIVVTDPANSEVTGLRDLTVKP